MVQQLLRQPGAVHTTACPPEFAGIIPAIIELVPAQVAHDHLVLPLSLQGETLKVAADNAHDIALRDKLTFLLNKKVLLVPRARANIIRAINFYYPPPPSAAPAVTFAKAMDARVAGLGAMPQEAEDDSEFDLCLSESETVNLLSDIPPSSKRKIRSPFSGGRGMFFYIVDEGQRVLMRHADGTMEVIVGPRRVWRGWSSFAPMAHHVAHPGEYLIVRYRDGRQEHLPGPAELWADPRSHEEISRQERLQLGSKEAVVVYTRQGEQIRRRIEYGPAQFMPQPGEWLHTFTWHASHGGHLGVEKVPRGLVFQKLWLMPDQMYHDVADVRTADDAVLMVRLMIFFELTDIERMLDTTHDPIGDFVNAATSDVVAFTGRFDFESFKRNVAQLNELETYRQLISRAQQCGYRINKVVYRGYGAPKPLQDMHDKAIEARTKLQLDRATEQQAQDLEDYKLGSQIARASKRRTEQTTELEHDLDMARRRQEADLQKEQAQRGLLREQRRLEAGLSQTIREQHDGQERQHLAALRELGVDLTAFLTQARADRVIELRGSAAGTHVHLDALQADNGKTAEESE